MTQSSDNPNYFIENEQPESIFVNRVFTYINTQVGQIFRNYATRQNVDFSHKKWYRFIPVLNWFADYIFEDVASVDLVTYDFTQSGFSSYDQQAFTDGDTESTNAYVIVGLSQGEQSTYIRYVAPTLVEVLSKFGGQVFGVVGLFGFLLSRYESFKYEMEALSTLYFYKSE